MPRDLKLGLKLTADAKGFVGEVRVSKKELDKLTGSTRKGAGANRAYTRATRQTEVATRQAGQSFLGAHGTMARFAASALTASGALRLLRTAFVNTVRQEQALAQVESRIRSTGSAAGLSTEQIAAMAAALQQVTTFGDEEILEAQSLLLSFRGIVGETFGAATEAALNLSIGLKQDLRSSVIALGKALDDPAKGLDALSRSGTKFTDAQKEVIRSLASSGDLAGAQAVILKELTVQYGNAARAARDTLGGALTALGNTFGDLLEVQSDVTDEWKESIERLNESLANIDANELHRDLASLAKVGGVVAALFGGRAAIALTAYAAKSTIASVRLRGLAVASTAAAAKTDVARLRMLAGASAARRYGGAVRGASLAVRGFSSVLSLFGGPLGIAALAAYGIYEFATANDRASDSLDGLPGEVDAFRESLEKLNAEQLGGRQVRATDALNVAQDDLALARKKASETREEIERNRKLSAEFAADTGGLTGNRVGTFFDKDAEQAATRIIRLADEVVGDAIAKVKEKQVELDLINARLKTPATRRPDALDANPNKTTPEPLDANLDKILQSLHSRERVIRDTYAAQIAAVRDGGAALIRALAKEGKTKQGVIKELEARQAGEIVKIQQQQEQIAARARQQAWEATGLPNLIDRLGDEQKITIAGVQARSGKEIALVTQHSAKLAALGINSTDLIARIEANGAAQITQITAEVTEERQRQEREAHDEKVRLRADQQAVELAGLLGFHDQIINAEYDKQGRLAALQSEQLAQAAGFQSQIVEQALAHKQQLIDAEYKYAPKVASILKKSAAFEVATKEKSGKLQLQTGLALAQESFANLATHSKKAFRLSQAAGIAQAIVATATGIANALAGPPHGPPFPLNFIIAAAVGTAGFAQIAAIRAQQPPQAFAMGGIVDSPTFFSARNVGRGVAGEAGTEAIMPVMRLPSGKLGVGYAGGGGRHITFAPVVQVEVVSGGDDATATGADIGRGVVTQLEPMFRGLLVNELRPGGLLNSAARV